MIPRSVLAKLVALGLSTGVVLGAALLVRPSDSPRIAGGGTPVAAQLGTRFADMAAGRLIPQRAEPVTAPRAPTPKKATRAEPALTAEKPAKAAAAPAPKPQAVQPVAPNRAASAAPQALTPVTPTRSAVSKPAPSKTSTSTAAKAPPRETVTAKPSDGKAPQLSKRPQLRDPNRAPAPRPAPQRRAAPAKPKPKPEPAPQGNAPRDNRQGAEVNSGGAAKQSGDRKAPSAPSGNAAAANYPGEVMARIARAGRPRVGARGTAVVSFTIAANGGLAQVAVARSSGSAALDRAALALIAKAAPFPRPPAGAQRRFSITIKGR